MPDLVVRYVRFVDALNRGVGRVVMWGVVVLLGILLYAAFSKAAFRISPIWTVEMAQFTLTAYYLLGGGFTLQNGAHVRMDLFYSNWTPRTRAVVDALTILCLIVYLAVLLYGAFKSTWFVIENGQRRPSAWRPYLWPIRSVMTVGILLMLMQATAIFCRDIAEARGRPIP
jgi:TRAP-type mannitol/chloroaromatic compound transport system permease small subunit